MRFFSPVIVFADNTKDTSEFAVATIRRWWNEEGRNQYKYAENLYITADGGGSNGSRNRLWKTQLQTFANETGLKVKAVLDETQYETGIKISDEELAKCKIIRSGFYSEWNYCIQPNY